MTGAMRGMWRVLRPDRRSSGHRWKLASAAFGKDLDAALTALLDAGGLPGVRALTPQERDVLVLYGVRNASAHRLGRSPLFAARFEDLARHLLFAVFHLVEHKYP